MEKLNWYTEGELARIRGENVIKATERYVYLSETYKANLTEFSNLKFWLGFYKLKDHDT